MGIDHRCADIPMPEQLLNRLDVVALFEQVGGEGMPKRVTTGGLRNPGFPAGLFDSPLQDGFVAMMPLLLTGPPITIELWALQEMEWVIPGRGKG